MKRREFIQFFALTAMGALIPTTAIGQAKEGIWLKVAIDENGNKEGWVSEDLDFSDDMKWEPARNFRLRAGPGYVVLAT